MGNDWQREQQLRADEATADDLPRVLMKTTKGDMILELYENEAPNTVANFISLIEDGYYNGLTFHRVIDRFMAQGGCPHGTGTGGPGYHIACECTSPDARHHYDATLSMAHAGPNTGGSQFFITFGPTPHLDRRHTVFGRVIEGREVLEKLERVEPSGRGGDADRMLEVSVVRKRDHEYKPQTV